MRLWVATSPLLVTGCLCVAACKTAETPAPPQGATVSSQAPKLEAPKVRLPDGARPTGYELALRVVPGEATFDGEVLIALEVDRPLDVLWLNARGLEARSAEFELAGEKIAATTQVHGEHFLAVVPARRLGPGQATVTIRYEGVLSDKDTSGVFQLKEDGERYAVTQFEPIDARRAFPCFDEPAFKVPWRLTLHVKREHQAFHNAPAESEHDEASGMKAVRFARTKPLPSYLVAFAVGPFETVEAGRWGSRQTAVRIITAKGKTGAAKYAVETTGPILEQLEAYFGTPYPYEKLDQLALPLGFDAMEHPGLVTYGHQLLLSAPEKDTLARQRSFATTAIHELGHMWFGDLVTMAWWDDIWLNEAFASWMESKIVETWRPAWGPLVERAQTRGAALEADSMVTARRIRQPIGSMDDITNVFDRITYDKGAAVIAMFEAYVGPEPFQRGVRRYLETYAWRNATATQFLDAVSHEVGRDIATAFSTFLDQPGAPRVSMQLSCPKGRRPRLTLEQRRHLPLGSRGDPNQLWQVPLCVRHRAAGHEARACTLLGEATGVLELDSPSCPDWVTPNDGALGYYRANLGGDSDLSRLLAKAGPRLSVAERVGLVDDISALVDSGDVGLDVALGTVPLVLRDNDWHLLATAQNLTRRLHDDILPEALRPKYEAFVRSTFGPRALELGLSVGALDDENARLSRPRLIRIVGVDGKEPRLRARSVALAKAWLDDRTAVHPDLVSDVLSIAADTGDQALHDALVEAVKREPDRSDRGRMVAALAGYHDVSLVREQLALALDKALDVREAMRLLTTGSDDYRTRDVVLEFLERNWDALLSRLPEDSGANLVWLGAGVCDTKRRDEVRTYFEGRSTKYLGGPRELDQAVETIDLCIAWRERHQRSAVAFIETWKPARATRRTR